VQAPKALPTNFFCNAGGCNCDGFRMTAHLRRCHEHRGRRPKAAKEGNRGGRGSSGAGALWRFGLGKWFCERVMFHRRRV
jgi:hypothetical protein